MSNTSFERSRAGHRPHWDGLGVFLSGVCLVHCLVPAVIGLTPLLGVGLLGHQQFHQLLLILVLPTAILGLYLGYRGHHRRYVIVIGAVGIAILGLISLGAHELLGERLEIIAAVIGSVVVATSHILNVVEARKAPCHEAA